MRKSFGSKLAVALGAFALVAGSAAPAFADGPHRYRHGYKAGHHGYYKGHHRGYRKGYRRGYRDHRRGNGIGPVEAIGIAAGVVAGAALLDAIATENRRETRYVNPPPSQRRYGYGYGYPAQPPAAPSGDYYGEDYYDAPIEQAPLAEPGFEEPAYDEPDWADDLDGASAPVVQGRSATYQDAYHQCERQARDVIGAEGGVVNGRMRIDRAEQRADGAWRITAEAPTFRPGGAWLARIDCVADDVGVRRFALS